MENLTCRPMTAADMEQVTALYMAHYNDHEGGCWTEQTTVRRILQVLTRMDSMCRILERDGEILGLYASVGWTAYTDQPAVLKKGFERSLLTLAAYEGDTLLGLIRTVGDGEYDFALEWYQDEETVWLVDGKKDPYTMERLRGMYEYLNDAGELYFIEALENGTYKPIGDVTFWQEDMPIVIGDPNYRGKGIGLKVILALIQRGRELGYDQLVVEEIYDWNTASRRCFEKAGFRAGQKTEKGARYSCRL